MKRKINLEEIIRKIKESNIINIEKNFINQKFSKINFYRSGKNKKRK